MRIHAHSLELGALAFKSLTVLSRSDLALSQAVRLQPVPEQMTRLCTYSASFLFPVPVSFFLIFLWNNSHVSHAVLLICRLVTVACHLAHHTRASPLLTAHHPLCCSFHPVGKTTHSRRGFRVDSLSCPGGVSHWKWISPGSWHNLKMAEHCLNLENHWEKSAPVISSITEGRGWSCEKCFANKKAVHVVIVTLKKEKWGQSFS